MSTSVLAAGVTMSTSGLAAGVTAVPRATYRLQLTPDFGFYEASEIAAYLATLGVSHAYCSPYLQAAPGSMHGYDIVDHGRVNDELGGAAGRDVFVGALAATGLGQVIDIVPNHMAIGSGNRWWWDVLMHGASSRFARHFDVDWSPPEAKLHDRVLLPVLGDHYGVVLRAGEVQLRRAGSTFTFEYFDHVVPVSPRTLDDLLTRAAAACGSDELHFVGEELGRLPLAGDLEGDGPARRMRATAVLTDLLGRIVAADASAGAAIDDVIATVNGGIDELHRLLDRQNYRLARWQTGTAELDYRRFFDVTELAGIRVEDPEVFDEVHRLALAWVADGSVTGLRVDHPDGLRDPAGYLERLADRAPGTWIVVEKILEGDEELRGGWPVAGTTGYEFLGLVGGLFVDPAGEAEITAAYVEATGDDRPFDEIAAESKRQIARDVLDADVARLVNLASQLCEADLDHRDHTRGELRSAIEALLVAFPVYRTYVRPGVALDPADESIVDAVIADVAGHRPDIDRGLLTLLSSVLRCRSGSALGDRLAVRFQQLTGPVMAKAVEDTAFYRFTRMVALNEVGGAPGRFGTDLERFHASNASAFERHPARMVATSTHDTKRSEDVRLRIAALTEVPGEWTAAARRWSRRCRGLAGAAVRDPSIEHLVHQTLVGAHPLGRERAHAYLTKAMREAKRTTSWLRPGDEHEAASHALLDALLDDPDHMAEVDRLARIVLPIGRASSLSQRLITLTSPGVPDLYQGSELWTDGLVDPDNRRPVDYRLRAALVEELRGASGELASASWPLDDLDDPGRAKLWVTMRALDVRRRAPEAFMGAAASYRPLRASGAAADHLVAFVRGGRVVTLASRLVGVLGRAGGWGSTSVELPAGRWTDVLTDRSVGAGRSDVADLLDRLPVALLVSADAGPT